MGDDQSARDWIGQVIGGRYRIVEALGEGAMGAVFVAEHLTLRKKVALKIIRAEHVDNEELRARFAREAMATAQLDHPHVVSAEDYGSLDDGSMYLVMQLVSGRTLRARLEEGPAFAWPDAADIGAQIADALTAAHAAGIVHRDLKPDNVMLKESRGRMRVRVLDFGIARVPTEAESAAEGAAPGAALTRLGRVMGTPGYMAPEQAMGDRVDERADIYALGVILWEMISNRRLFSGAEATDVIAQQLTTTPEPVTGVPEELATLIAKMIHVEREHRPEKVDEIHDALRRLVRRARRTPLANEAVTRESLPKAASSRPPFGFLVGGCAAAALVVMTVGLLGGIWAFSGDDDDDAPETQPGAETITAHGSDTVPESESATESAAATESATAAESAAEPDPEPPDALPPNPWAAPIPDTLARIRAHLDAGHSLSGRVDRELTGFAARHPDDARPFLLLARIYLSRRWRADAIEQYERAFRRDPAARGDPQMLADLVALVPHNTAGDAAADLIDEAYGAEALPAIEAAIEAERLDPHATARLVLLRSELTR